MGIEASTIDRLVDKSKEAFTMAIEVYNKPSIKYRLEGFSFFICNAWELMLKAYLIKRDGTDAVYYSDKPERTISLENCIQKVFTNKNDPLRRNLEKIVELRNTSTHFITEEYEAVYVPLLQACVFNFVDKMKAFHDVDMTEVIPENFITLSVRLQSLSETEIRGKYSRQIAEKLISTMDQLNPDIEASNSRFAIRIEHFYYSTKKREEATELYHLEKEAKEGVRVIRELKDPNALYQYNAKAVIKEINKRVQKAGINLLYHENETAFNMYHFNLFCKYFGLKENDKMCFVYQVSMQPQYSYSQRAVDFIFDEIKKNPERIIDDIKDKIKKSTPGAKDSK